MVRAEFILAGCILIILGVILAMNGYDAIQSTTLDTIVSVAETISGQKAPDALHHSRSQGYALLTGGGVAILVGLLLVLKSRKPN